MCGPQNKPRNLLLASILVLLSSTLYAQDPSLVLYFSFDDDLAGQATDHSVYGNNGTVRGNPAPAQGKFGSALMFDAVDDQVVVPTSATLDIQDQITIMAWINPGANLTADWRTVVGKSPSSTLGSAQFSYDIRTENTGVLRFSLYIGGWRFVFGPTLVPGTWYHVAGTYDGSQMVFYVNGASAGTTATSGKINVTPDPVCIGNIVNAAGIVSNEYWSGIIDEVRIWNKALSGEEVATKMAQGKAELLGPQLAMSPEPGNGQTDVLRTAVLSWTPGKFANTHDVYFGAIFDDVNNASRTNQRGVLASQGQIATTYDPPGRLDLGQTYYWRVDEVNAPPTSTIFKGDVWSFTVEPLAYPIEGVTATASSTNKAEEGPENTVNGSGLNASDLHSASNTDMWLSSMTGAQPTWIQYEFDRVHKLYQMMVWNYNTTVEPAIGFGIKEAAIEYSTDGVDWATLGTTHEFTRGPGSAGYAPNTTVDLGGVAAKYVKITANSNWGGFVKQYGLSEVRFSSIPIQAREPNPASGAADIGVDATLSWRAGREAAKHNVYLSTDEQAVIDGTAPVVTITSASYASTLDLASTYYWRIDEVNDVETPAAWQGAIWNLSTQEYLVVDDFESYNDIPAGQAGSNLVYETWADGFGTTTNGSTIGYVTGASMETSTVYDGKQSVALLYDNATASVSEITASVANLQADKDWTKHGIKGLTLRFYGDPNNVPQQMYAKINGAKVIYDGDAQNLKQPGWQMWYVDPASLGMNLSNVTTLTIGFERVGTTGGQGMILLDGIRLYSYERQLITPIQPDPAGLVTHWKFDEGSGTVAQDSSPSGYVGTFNGDPQWVTGQFGHALDFDGTDDFVEYDLGAAQTWLAYSVGLWAKADVLGMALYKSVFSSHTPNTSGFQMDVDGRNPGSYRYSGAGTGTHLYGPLATDWVHLGTTCDGTTTTLYYNGRPAATINGANLVFNRIRVGVNRIGDSIFDGAIDDFRLYDRALPAEEVAGLAGVTTPFDKPF